MSLSSGGPGQTFTKPLREIFPTHLAAGDVCDSIRDYLVLFNEIIATSLDEQFEQIEGCSFVAICKPVVGNNSMDKGGRLLMNESVVAVIGASKGGTNRVLV